MLGRARLPISRDVARRERHKRGASLFALAGMILALTPAITFSSWVTSAETAQAAPIPIAQPQAQMANHTGLTGNGGTPVTSNSGNCIRYSPANNATSSTFVGAGGTAYAAHGYNNNCPTNLNLGSQSALGFEPAALTTVNPNTVFNIGRVVHVNNPVTTSSDFYRGDLVMQWAGQTLTFPWQMWETPNGSSANCPTGWWAGPSNCLDEVKFGSLVGGTSTFTGTDGLQYSLVLSGFSGTNANNNNCPATPNATSRNQFLTNEGASTYGCLYGIVNQVRPVTIVKVAEAPYGQDGATIPTFSFSSSSTLTGSPWQTPFTLTPTGLGVMTPVPAAAKITRNYSVGESVTITETTADPWSLNSVVCKDGDGANVGTTSATGVTLAVGATTVASAVPITCTFTNNVAPKATLTLAKTVTSTGQVAPVALPSGWTLTAQRTATIPSSTPATTISGTGGSAAVIARPVATGTYTLTETATGANTGGYEQSGPWVCRTSTGAPVTVTNGQITLTHGQIVTCTVTNVYSTGELRITKTVNGAGYTGAATGMSFTAHYVCTSSDGRIKQGDVTLAPGAANGTAGAYVSVPGVAAGSSCVVTETNAPTGSTQLSNGSWTWLPPTNPAAVTVVKDGFVTANIGNTNEQKFGTFTVNKVISQTGSGQPGYTGGPARTFPITWVCSIGGVQVASGSNVISTGTPFVSPPVPATATCVVTEVPVVTETGDFETPSYAWSATPAPQSVTVSSTAAASTTFTNTYTLRTAALRITKTVVGEGYTPASSGTLFTANVTCGTGANAVTIPYPISAVGAAGPAVQVPVGVLCTIVETPPTQASAPLAAGYTWGTPSYTTGTPATAGNTLTVPAGGQGVATITNYTVKNPGTFSVTKVIDTFASAVAPGTTFPINVTCTLAGVSNYTSSGATIATGTPWVSPQLPAGTACDVSEVAPSGSTNLPDASYAWGTGPAAQSVTVEGGAAPATTLTFHNTIVRVKAPFTVIKVVNPAAGSPVTPGFNGEWTCTYGSGAGAVVSSGNWNTGATGGTATMTGADVSGGAAQVLVGSRCSATEAAPSTSGDQSYVWTTVTGEPVAVPAGGASVTVTNTLTRTTGSITIAKSVTGGSAPAAFPADTTFGFDYTCQPVTGSAISGTRQVAPGAAVSIPDIPGGSVCTVTELANPAATNPYTWDGVSFDVAGATGTPGTRAVTFTTPVTGAQVTATATNIISVKTGRVEVSKTVAAENKEGFTGGSIFSVSLVCTTGTFGPTTIADGAAATFTVPLGSVCNPFETNPSGGLLNDSFAWGPATFGSEVTVSTPGATVATGVTNHITRVYDQLQVTKSVLDGGFPGVISPALSYNGGWTCTLAGAGGATVSGTWSGTDPTQNDGGTPGTLAATGGTAAGTVNVLRGSVCSVTEPTQPAPSTDTSYYWLTPTLSGTTVAPGLNTIAVTNTLGRNSGNLVVSKTLSGESAGVLAETRFPVSATCSFPGATTLVGNALVAAGAAPVSLISNVPAGWTCTVAEGLPQVPGDDAANGLVDSSYAWGSTSYTIDGATTAEVSVTSGGSHAVVVTNDVTRVRGTFAITKVLAAGVPELDDATFAGTWTCVYREGLTGEESFNGTWSVQGAGAATVSGPQVPLGSVCTVVETLPDNALLPDASWTWAAATVAAAPGAPVTVTNDVTRNYSGLSVTKVADDVVGLAPGVENYEGSWECTYDGTSVSGRWSVPVAGGTQVLVAASEARIPATSDCVITEDTLTAASLVNSSYAWNAPTYSPALGEVETVAGQVVDVTVTNSTTRVLGEFGITKVIEARDGVELSSVDPGLTFSGAWQCVLGTEVLNGNWGPLAAGARVSVPGIPMGAACTVTETAPTFTPVSSDPSFVWLASSATGVTVDVTPADTTAVVTNPVTRISGSFGVTKIVQGDLEGVDEDGLYAFTWTCTAPNGDTFPGAQPGTFSIAAGDLWNSPTVPDGSECTVTETGTATPVHPSYAWTGTQAVVVVNNNEMGSSETSSITFDAEGPDDVVLVEVTNTLTRTIGSFSVAKSANPPSGSTVDPGSEITYFLTVTPGAVGFVDDVVVLDDLTGVLENAAVVADSITAPDGTSASVSGGLLTWNVGTLDSADGPIVLSYKVRVNDDAVGVRLVNVVTGDGEVPPEQCPIDMPAEPAVRAAAGELDPNCSTTHVTPGWTLAKSSAAPSPLLPGSTVTYTLTATNTSEGEVTGALAIDDLSDVLDDATLVQPLPAGLTLVGTTLTWAIPDLAAGAEPVSVTYSVTVKSTAAGKSLRNVVVPDGPSGSCLTCETTDPVMGWALAKTSTPGSKSIVTAGQTVSYTLTVTNTGQTLVTGAVVTDQMADVLDDADLLLPLPAGLTRTGTVLTWAVPDVAVGSSVTVTYQVKVKALTAAASLVNVATPGSPGGECTVCTTTHTFTPPTVTPLKPTPVKPKPQLPSTGANSLPMLGAGGALVLMGALLVVTRRRRDDDGSLA